MRIHTERERDIHTHTHTHTHTQRETHRHRERETQTQRERHTDTQRERHRREEGDLVEDVLLVCRVMVVFRQHDRLVQQEPFAGDQLDGQPQRPPPHASPAVWPARRRHRALLTHTHTLSLSLSHTHTHTTHTLSLTHTHNALSLSYTCFVWLFFVFSCFSLHFSHSLACLALPPLSSPPLVCVCVCDLLCPFPRGAPCLVQRAGCCPRMVAMARGSGVAF